MLHVGDRRDIRRSANLTALKSLDVNAVFEDELVIQFVHEMLTVLLDVLALSNLRVAGAAPIRADPRPH